MMLKTLIKMISYRLDGDQLFWIAEFVDFRLRGEFDCSQVKGLIKLAVAWMKREKSAEPPFS